MSQDGKYTGWAPLMYWQAFRCHSYIVPKVYWYYVIFDYDRTESPYPCFLLNFSFSFFLFIVKNYMLAKNQNATKCLCT